MPRLAPPVPPKSPPPIPAAEPDCESDADDLKAEERESNPTSEIVTLKLTVSPPVRATVTWGIKKLALVQPSDPTVQIERPRGSGPLDIEIRADGFLPHHTRLFTDRDDKLSVHLVRGGDGSGVPAYRRPESK